MRPTTRAAAAALLALLALTGTSGLAAAPPKVINDDTQFAEGPIWHAGKLYYVEYARNTVTVWDAHRNSNNIFWSKPGCGPSAVTVASTGEFLVTCYDSNSIGRIAADGHDLPPWTHDAAGHPFVGPNDFASDHAGGMYFSCSGQFDQHIDGQIFHVDRKGTITQVAIEVPSANGLVVSGDGSHLYVIETENHRIQRYRIGPGHGLSGRELFVDLGALTHVTPIYPDGIKLSHKGELYVGQNPRDPKAPLAGTIFVLNEQGALLRSLQLPSPGVPNFAFGPDGATLYVAALDQLDQAPYRGKIYALSLR